jgi:hypothetical protein
MLTNKYKDLGFELSRLNGLQVLKFRNRIFFILGENVHIRNVLVQKLCDTYLNSFMSSAQMVPAEI